MLSVFDAELEMKEDLANEVHEVLRTHRLTEHDVPLHLCPFEYRMCINSVCSELLERFEVELAEQASISHDNGYENGYEIGYKESYSKSFTTAHRRGFKDGVIDALQETQHAS